ncbi:unnamed protein product [Protopolystoma xenopodis]|uniref:Uncharacterized protein n=1 Tax=Protopolystoma xenopodis TaxID=117903 RepID=A0A3S5B7X7_9PLAT|nr:unnamed protein product [Protopolystoma xenopodis]
MDEEKCSFLASLVNRRFLQWLSDTGNLRQLRQLEPEVTDCDHGLIASARQPSASNSQLLDQLENSGHLKQMPRRRAVSSESPGHLFGPISK